MKVKVAELEIQHKQASDSPAFALPLYVCGTGGREELPPDYILSVPREVG